jgi:dipeptidyl aminopeptidase/acylaminoacyl peptidase
MKSSVRLGVIFFVVGLIIFGIIEAWGADWKYYLPTDRGYLFYPNVSNDKALVYCHGGFGEVTKPDAPDVVYYVSQGWTVFVLRYRDEFGNPRSIKKDVQETMDAIFSLKDKFRSIHLLGISRGGFVALQTFARYGGLFGRCVAVVAPTHIESWKQMNTLPKRLRYYFEEMDDPYGYFEEMPLADRFELGRKLLLMYGIKDDLVPVSQGIELSKEINCKIILVDSDHGLFNEKQNVKMSEAFLHKGIEEVYPR